MSVFYLPIVRFVSVVIKFISISFYEILVVFLALTIKLLLFHNVRTLFSKFWHLQKHSLCSLPYKNFLTHRHIFQDAI